jgi:parvulin-like peptidyl-prolyl isomerase
MNVFLLICLIVSALAQPHIGCAEEIQSNTPAVEQPIENVLQENATQAPSDDKPDTNDVNTPNRFLIDKIVARVNGTNILQSDLDQPRISKEGSTYSLNEAIIEEVLYQRASEMHMLPTNTDIERQLVAFKIQNNMADISDKEFELLLKQSGFTINTYKNQLGRLYATENVRRAEVSEKIVVTSQEVETYHKAHPTYSKDEFLLMTATLTADQLEQKDTLIAENKIAWDDLGWIEKEDIGKKFEIVFSMQKGDISNPIKIDEDTYQIVKLADKKDRHLKTLNESYGEIERKLQDERKDTYLKTFEDEIKANATIVYL